MKLLIVESPGKIGKLKHILGSGWDVKASCGHVRDLPIKELGINEKLEPEYTVIPDKEKIVKELQEAVKEADTVYLATDPDREGEAIAWHLAELLKLKTYKRVTYTSITPKEVLAGIGNARSIDMALVKAQEARRVLDRIVGYPTCRPLSNAIGETVSAGRVQSPAVRLVVEREREIRSFKVTQHYGVEAVFDEIENIQDGWKATWKTDNFLEAGQEYILDKSIAEKVAKAKNFEVLEYEESESKTAPPAPFTTSSLQQTASQKLKFTPKETMSIAQSLYEAGLITYMRTDSPNLSDEAYEEIKSYALEQGLPVADQKRTWKSKEGSQESHEAIRPTEIAVYDIEAGEKERLLYELIRNRALACVLEDAVFAVKQAKLKALIEEKEAIFEAKGRLLTDKGWKAVYDNSDEEEAEESNPIPKLKAGNSVVAQQCRILTKQTKAKSRYTQATLIRELEKKGIGRPATYASILSNILDKKYIREDDKNKLFATELGEKLLDAMYDNFSFIDLDFTKDMEQELDNIAESKSSYSELVGRMHRLIMQEIDDYNAKNAVPCPKCGSPLKHILNKQKGYDFFACKNEECQKIFDNVNGIPIEQKPKITDQICPKCGSLLKHIYNKQKGYDFFACEKEECKEVFDNINGKPQERTPKITDQTCLKCGSPLKHCKGVSKTTGKAYDFFICENEECRAKFNNENGKPVEQHIPEENSGRPTEFNCKKCGKTLLARPTSKGGIWYACSGYPHCDAKYWAKDDGTPDFEGSASKKTTIKAKRK